MNNTFFNFQKVLDAVGPSIDALVTGLYPEARKEPGCYRVGSSDGERGKSFSISTRPNNAGCYYDFANPEVRGNAISLVGIAKNINYEDAGRWLASYLQVPPEERLHMPKKRNPPVIDRTVIKQLNKRSVDYALSRGITEETLHRFKCCSTDTHIIFPHFSDENEPVLMKFWSCDGRKNMFSNENPVPVLFGKHLIDPVQTGGALIITEGQWDAMTWSQLGYPAVSIPSGVSNDEWISEDWNFLNRFSDIYLDFDDDQPGREAESKAKVRLGYERCKTIKYRFKDANDALKANGTDVLAKAFVDSREAPIEHIVKASDMKSKVRESLNRTNATKGIPFFLRKLGFEFRPHEATIWFGNTSHGKALPLDMLVPTTHGHSTMKMLKEGDYVYGSNGQPTRIIATSEVFEGNDCYEIQFQDKLKLVADANHLWALDTHYSRASKRNRQKRVYTQKANYRQDAKMNNGVTMTTEELFNSNLKINIGGQERFNFTIQVAPAFEGVETDLPIPPYTLGAWLGDGTSANAQITSHPSDSEIIRRIEADGFAVEKKKPQYLHLIKNLQVTLRKNNLIKNKHIPEAYFNASKEQRMDLLRGLMDTDGTISNGRQCEFCSVKEHFAHQVQRLANGLGIKACMNVGNAVLNGRVVGKKYRVQWTNSEPVFHLSRKLERLPKVVGPDAMNRTIVSVRKVKSVPTKCIVVDAPDHLFLCTEHCVITHNSTLLGNQVVYGASLGEMTMVASFEQATAMTMASMMTQYTSDAQIGFSSDFDAAYEELSSRVLFFDSMARCNPDELIATMTLAHKQLGITTFVVDNVMTLEVDRQDNTAQASVADKFRVFVARYPVHVHLVAHPRKQQDGNAKPPSITDIRGASEWGDMFHNVILIHRDVAKAERISQMYDEGTSDVDIQIYDCSMPDGRAMVRKQRDSGNLPMISYRFDAKTKRAWKDADDAAPYWWPDQ